MTPHTPPSLTNNRAQRRYDIDALRVMAFALLILYHVGMFYVADWDWHVKSRYLSEPLQAPMGLVNPWRMPLIFLISGVAVHFLLGKISAARFALSRTRRLLIPLLFGMAVIVPPQAYLQAVSNGAFVGHYGEFLWHYFTFQPWPADAFDGSDMGITWNHLWYLPYLLTYSLILVLMLPLLRSHGFRRVVEWFHSMGSWQVVIVPAVPFLVYEWLLDGRFPVTHAFFGDWDNHAVSFTAFFLGYLLGSRNKGGLWDEIARLRWVTLILAIGGYIWLVGLRDQLHLPASLESAAELLIPVFHGWCWLLTILGWGYRWLNRPFPWLAYATEAVYPCYVLHQTLTIVAGYHLGRLALGPVVEPLLVLAVTLLGCLMIHEFVIRRVRLLRPLFGMKSEKVTGIPAGTKGFANVQT